MAVTFPHVVVGCRIKSRTLTEETPTHRRFLIAKVVERDSFLDDKGHEVFFLTVQAGNRLTQIYESSVFYLQETSVEHSELKK